jgi:septal ring factor EnvC (AmiA/AmiB activator)
MSELAERIRAARTRVQELQRERARAQASVASLEAELRDRQRAADVLQARIAELERENEVLRSVKAAPAADDRSGTKERIDELVNEIDRCLALLHA